MSTYPTQITIRATDEQLQQFFAEGETVRYGKLSPEKYPGVNLYINGKGRVAGRSSVNMDCREVTIEYDNEQSLAAITAALNALADGC